MAPVMDHPPVVDLSNFEERKEEIVADLMKAATTVGFFYIENHGVPQELIDRAFSSFSEYCDMPQEVKNSLPRVDWTNRKILGYEVNRVPGIDGEYKIVRESHIQSYEVHEEARGSWPQEKQLPGFRDTTLEFMNALPPVVDRVLSCFAIGLGYPEDKFKQTIDVSDPDNHTFLQYHKYPLTNGMLAKESTKRLTAHTDESLMTLLFTSPGSAGLELAAGKDGKAVDAEAGHYEVESWHPCPPLPGKISINIGDPLQFMSDGLLKSNYHRVRMPKAGEPGENKTPRFSIGYFVWPKDDYVIQGPKKVYPAITMAEFMKVKGKLYGAGFSEDPKVYEAHSDIAMGVPKMSTAATQLTAIAAS